MGTRTTRASGEKIVIFDSTLRDGTQMEGFVLSLHDKLAITRLLDSYGVDYIEGGWPGSNDKDAEYFRTVRDLKLRHARVTAFGSTRRAKLTPKEDANLRALVAAKSDAVIIFGKAWDLHVTAALNTTLDNNLLMIRESLAYLREHTHGQVMYDAEHYFDGYKANPDYALRSLAAAAEGGAEALVLCDTNGGSMPWEIFDIVTATRAAIKVPIGIHCHNDGAMAVANTLEAVKAGVRHVQGTINGVGERIGNADLVSIIINLQAKLGYRCLPAGKLEKITALSRAVYEIANMIPPENQPFVGRHAFAHKGGVHVSAVMKDPRTYEHIAPGLIGNERSMPISELSGRANILARMQGYKLEEQPEKVQAILQAVQKNEHEGYQYEAAHASFELLTRRILGKDRPFFALEGFRVIVEKRDERPVTVATVKVKVGDQVQLMAAEGDGPVNALDTALRQALERFYPVLGHMRLTDFKVRVINASAATAAKVRVIIASQYKDSAWGTVGVSENLIEASWIALVDSINFMLLKFGPKARA
ncbi:MAG: citramalate synthase [Planctomycetota bacterium]